MRRKREAAADKLFPGLFSQPGVEHFPTVMTGSVRVCSGSVPGQLLYSPPGAWAHGARCRHQASTIASGFSSAHAAPQSPITTISLGK